MAEVNTIYGLMNEAELEKKVGSVDNDDEYTTWTEFYLNGEMVHRSVHVMLKKNVSIEAVAAEF